MAYLPQQVISQGVVPLGTGQNMVNTPPPVIIMVPAPAPVKEKIPYNQRFPKKLMLSLGYIQLAMAILGIITQVIGISNSSGPSAHYAGAGIWCGLFFGLSAMFGIMASLKPSFSTIVTCMVFAIIAAVFCLPLLVISSIGAAVSSHCYYGNCDGREIKHVMFAIQIIISLIQVVTAITSSAMSCRAICSCCRPSKENNGIVYYSNTGGNGTHDVHSQQIFLQQQQPGYITIPMCQIQAAAASVGATALLNEGSIPGATITDAESPPPRYESVAVLKKEEDDVNESKYQRF